MWRLDDPEEPMFAIEDTTKGIIGQAGLRIWPEGRSRAVATIAIFDPRNRGLGIGTAVMRSLLAYAFRKLDLSEVAISVDESNTRAMGCYRKAGFAEIRRDGEGAVFMRAERETWLALKPDPTWESISITGYPCGLPNGC